VTGLSFHSLTLPSMDGQWSCFREDNTYNNRLCVVIVLIPMNNYPLGYAIGDRENTELIRQANRNAILHTQELFGQAYRPGSCRATGTDLKPLLLSSRQWRMCTHLLLLETLRAKVMSLTSTTSTTNIFSAILTGAAIT
jgi:hypothetical protein